MSKLSVHLIRIISGHKCRLTEKECPINLERLLSANKELQDNMEVLQTELGRKQTEFEKLLDERYFRRCGNSSF